MTTTIKLDKNTKDKLRKLVEKPFKNIRQFWGALALMINRDTQLTFRHQGARGGHEAWQPFSRSTLRTPAGTRKIRYGTDLRPLDPSRLRTLRARWGYGQIGEMRKGVRRYDESSKLLQASGMFRNSFGLIKLGRDRLVYGTKHKLAEQIMSVKNRQVLFITGQDEQRYASQFKSWYLKGLV